MFTKKQECDDEPRCGWIGRGMNICQDLAQYDQMVHDHMLPPCGYIKDESECDAENECGWIGRGLDECLDMKFEEDIFHQGGYDASREGHGMWYGNWWPWKQLWIGGMCTLYYNIVLNCFNIRSHYRTHLDFSNPACKYVLHKFTGCFRITCLC